MGADLRLWLLSRGSARTASQIYQWAKIFLIPSRQRVNSVSLCGLRVVAERHTTAIRAPKAMAGECAEKQTFGFAACQAIEHVEWSFARGFTMTR